MASLLLSILMIIELVRSGGGKFSFMFELPNYEECKYIIRSGSGLDVFYSISYLWFSAVGIIIAVIVGLLTSFITGPNSIDDVPIQYQIPLFGRLCCCLPKSVLYRLNCCRHFDKNEVYPQYENDREVLIKSESYDTSFSESKRGKNRMEISQTGLQKTTHTEPLLAQKLGWYGAVSESKDRVS